MANWTLTSDELPMGRKEVSIPDSKFNFIWEEFKSYNGSHKDFFINRLCGGKYE